MHCIRQTQDVYEDPTTWKTWSHACNMKCFSVFTLNHYFALHFANVTMASNITKNDVLRLCMF